MRVIVWGINYAPEFTGIAPHSVALCEFLRGVGHEVEMVTSFAYYPTWQKQPEDRGHFYRTDLVNGVPIHRCWHFVPAKVSAPKRILHEGSFVLTSMLRALTLPRPDVYVVVSPPLLLGVAAWF
ncbi:MAG TPA: glycosyltransferase, partial [Chthoniobacterales bacterium]